MLRKTLLWLDTPAWQEAPDFKCVGPREVRAAPSICISASFCGVTVAMQEGEMGSVV